MPAAWTLEADGADVSAVVRQRLRIVRGHDVGPTAITPRAGVATFVVDDDSDIEYGDDLTIQAGSIAVLDGVVRDVSPGTDRGTGIRHFGVHVDGAMAVCTRMSACGHRLPVGRDRAGGQSARHRGIGASARHVVHRRGRADLAAVVHAGADRWAVSASVGAARWSAGVPRPERGVAPDVDIAEPVGGGCGCDRLGGGQRRIGARPHRELGIDPIPAVERVGAAAGGEPDGHRDTEHDH